MLLARGSKSAKMLQYPFDTIIFFLDLVILNTMRKCHISSKSISTRQEIDKNFDDDVKKFDDFLTSRYLRFAGTRGAPRVPDFGRPAGRPGAGPGMSKCVVFPTNLL